MVNLNMTSMFQLKLLMHLQIYIFLQLHIFQIKKYILHSFTNSFEEPPASLILYNIISHQWTCLKLGQVMLNNQQACLRGFTIQDEKILNKGFCPIRIVNLSFSFRYCWSIPLIQECYEGAQRIYVMQLNARFVIHFAMDKEYSGGGLQPIHVNFGFLKIECELLAMLLYMSFLNKHPS